tara:strand:+ start:109 stop:330 length:222 start_codon:yes stop_codon:yes gene_type:complete
MTTLCGQLYPLQRDEDNVTIVQPLFWTSIPENLLLLCEVVDQIHISYQEQVTYTLYIVIDNSPLGYTSAASSS